MNRSEAGRLGGLKGGIAFSLACQAIREEYSKNPKLCEYCKKAIPFEKRRSKFCNHSCAASSTKNRNGTGSESCCRYCKLPIERGKSSHESCRTHGKWTQFEDLKSDGVKKQRLISERGARCERCLLDSWQGVPIVLTMDHVDGNPDNGSRENLKLLCWNCHSLTPTFGGKNIGKFPNAKRVKKRQEKRIS